MRHSLAVLLVLLLAQVVVSPETFAQRTDSTDAALPTLGQQEEVRGVSLEQNYPNPFRTETRIPFVLGADLFEDGRSVVVSVRVYNIIGQHIASPVVVDNVFAAGQPAEGISYDVPGRFEVLWDGRDNGGNMVASGLYFCRITANGAQDIIKMLVRR